MVAPVWRKYQSNSITRMHSSRMRTACSSSRPGGGGLHQAPSRTRHPLGADPPDQAPPLGADPPGTRPPSGPGTPLGADPPDQAPPGSRHPPGPGIPPVNRMTKRRKNITLPKLRLRAVKRSEQLFLWQLQRRTYFNHCK